MQRHNRLPPGQSLTLRSPTLHYGPVPVFDPSTWDFRIWGAVEKSLTPDHSYSLRAVIGTIPGRDDLKDVYIWKGAKWLRSLEFMTEDRSGFWESNGYHNEGDVLKEQRAAPESTILSRPDEEECQPSTASEQEQANNKQ